MARVAENSTHARGPDVRNDGLVSADAAAAEPHDKRQAAPKKEPLPPVAEPEYEKEPADHREQRGAVGDQRRDVDGQIAHSGVDFDRGSFAIAAPETNRVGSGVAPAPSRPPSARRRGEGRRPQIILTPLSTVPAAPARRADGHQMSHVKSRLIPGTQIRREPGVSYACAWRRRCSAGVTPSSSRNRRAKWRALRPARAARLATL